MIREAGQLAICQLVLLWVKQLMRVLGLDFGSKTTGVAVSDPLGFTAQGLETITREDENKLRRTCARRRLFRMDNNRIPEYTTA